MNESELCDSMNLLKINDCVSSDYKYTGELKWLNWDEDKNIIKKERRNYVTQNNIIN